MLSKVVKTQNRVAWVDCGPEGRVCGNLPKPENEAGVSVIYITSKGIYGFKDKITRENLLNWLSADNFMSDKPMEEDMNAYAEMALGIHEDISKKMNRWKRDFTVWLETYVKTKFKKVPMVDRWSSNAKALILIVGTIPPVVFTLFFIIVWCSAEFNNFMVDRKYKSLNEKMKIQKKKE